MNSGNHFTFFGFDIHICKFIKSFRIHTNKYHTFYDTFYKLYGGMKNECMRAILGNEIYPLLDLASIFPGEWKRNNFQFEYYEINQYHPHISETVEIYSTEHRNRRGKIDI